jgi:hypothetical protein
LELRAGEVLFYDSEAYNCFLSMRGAAQEEPCGTVAFWTLQQLVLGDDSEDGSDKASEEGSEEGSDDGSDDGLEQNADQEVRPVGRQRKADNSVDSGESDVDNKRNVRRKLH